MQTVRVQITAEDIANGDHTCGTRCAGYRAMKRVVPTVDVVLVTRALFRVPPDTVYECIFPEWVSRKLSQLFWGHHVAPFEFNLKIPERFLTHATSQGANH